MTPFKRFTIADTAIMLVDHQTTTIDWVRSLPKSTTVASCRVLTRMALDYAMPLVLTTTMEEYVGPTIADISELAPAAFDKRFKRGGELSCWDAADLRDGVKALNRPNLILAGLTTDICLFWAAVDAQALGYRVTVVADACGTMSALGDQVTFDRLRGQGVAVTVVNQAVTELVGNFGTPDGQKAQQIMADEIIEARRMTLTIDADATLHTLINIFVASPGEQDRIVASLRSFTEDHARALHGFVGAAVHASVDGARVINYVQWESEADLRAMLATPAARRHMAEVGALAESVTPTACRIAYVGSRSLDAD